MRLPTPTVAIKIPRAWLELKVVQMRLRTSKPEWIGEHMNLRADNLDGDVYANKQHVSLNNHLRAARQWHEVVRLAGRLQFKPATCLSKSIALVRLLRRCNICANLCLGVAVHNGELKSHAWVEVASTRINEPTSVGHEFTHVKVDQWLQQEEGS